MKSDKSQDELVSAAISNKQAANKIGQSRRKLLRKRAALMRAQPDWPQKKAEYLRRFYEKHPDYHYRRVLWQRYGLTYPAYLRLLKQQGNRCALCDKTFVNRRYTMVDHDHQTGRVRGLLCGGCNWTLGWYENRQERIQRYLAVENSAKPAGRAAPARTARVRSAGREVTWGGQREVQALSS